MFRVFLRLIAKIRAYSPNSLAFLTGIQFLIIHKGVINSVYDLR